MAILGEIRKQTWLLIVVIGIAMIAFLAGDLFSENSVLKRVFTGDPNEVGSVNGESISLAEFIDAQNRMNNQNASQNQISEQVWNALVSQKIIEEHAEKAGLEVSDDEVWEFLAKQYGMPDAEQLKTQVGQLKTQSDQGTQGASQAYQNFLSQFEAVKPSILGQKYQELVAMGMASTKNEAEFQQISNIQSANVDYAFASYDDLKKKYNVEVTDDEINAYIKKYPKKYERDATVNLSFVYFPASPSKKDEESALSEIKKYLTQSIQVDKINNITDTIPSFASSVDDSAYITKYSDRPYNSQYITRKDIERFASQLPKEYVDFLTTANVGQIGGPFKTGNAYQLVKVSKTKEIADSINSSHILISYTGTKVAAQNTAITRSREQAKVLADSILKLVQSSSADFTKLVAQYSDDLGSKTKNGNIGWVARTSQSLAPEYLQFLNSHKNGEIGMTESSFGFHIIKIDGTKNQTGYLFANILKEIKPSQKTSETNFTNARNFAQEIEGKSLNDFANIAQKKGYNYNTADDVERYYATPLVDPNSGFSTDKDNDILKWAFNKDTNPGSTNLFTTVNEDQIIVRVNSKASKGLVPANSVRKDIEPIIIHEKLTKLINDKLGANPSLDAYVKEFSATKGNSSITFGSAQLAGKGPEPLVAGVAFGLKQGATSNAIKGNSGVYVINLKSLAAPPKVDDTSLLVDQLNSTLSQSINQKLNQSLIDASEIEDYRQQRLDRQ